MYSIKVTYNKNRVKSNGNATVYIQVIIDSEVWLYNTEVEWPHKLIYDFGIKPRTKQDRDQSDLQLVIDQRLSRVKDIILADRLGEQSLTIKKLKHLILNYDSKKDFIVYMRDKIQQRYDDEIIKKRTFKNNMTSLGKLSEFKEQLFYSEIKEELFEKLKAHLTRRGYKNNYIAGIFKDIKKYLRLAKKDGIRFNDITGDIKSPKTSRSLVYLTEVELDRLYKTYHDPLLTKINLSILKQFLFSTETGIRISDISLLKWDHIDDDRLLNFVPFKTRGLEKRVTIPLTKTALKLIEEESGFIFKEYAHPVINRGLKVIAAMSGIKKNLTFHVARHTFATRFLSKGGRVEVLQRLLGHTKIETTMVYVHVDLTRLKDEMKLMDVNREL